MKTPILLSAIISLGCIAGHAQAPSAANTGATKKTNTATYVIPVVFHVLHQYGNEDISDAQVNDAVRILNEDFQARNADTANIVPSFKSLKGNMDVEFRLAKLDPNGHCTSGIEHIASPFTNGSDDQVKIHQWDPSKYLNIWTVKQINVNGYGSYCSTITQAIANPAIDGIVMLVDYVGSIGTGISYTSRALTFEAGRYLNLKKTWGDANLPGIVCGDDSISDTPITKGWTTCNPSGSVCNPPIIENVQNFMEYAYCSKMFTQGQVQWVHACLNSPSAHRNNLWQPANLIATGTDNASYTSTLTCKPTADFKASHVAVCAGTSITFADASYNGPVSSHQWTFNGGAPAASTASSPAVIYNAPGTYSVSLKVSNAQGSDSITKTGYIHVQPVASPNGHAIAESFESLSITNNNNWPVISGNDAYTWVIANTGYTGNKSMMIDNFHANDAGDVDEIITPPMDLAGSPVTLTFMLAYVQTSNSSVDQLKVLVSKDCGATWNQFYNSGYPIPATGSITTTPYVPQHADWQMKSVAVPASAVSSSTMFKFSFTSAHGNNIYIDDINTSSPVSVESLAGNIRSLEVLPNPFSDEATIRISANTEETVQMDLRDILGKTVLTIPGNKLLSGDNTFTLHGNDLAKGLYFLNVSTGTSSSTKKVVIE